MTEERHVSQLVQLVASGLDLDSAAARLGLTTQEAEKQLTVDTAKLRDNAPTVEGERMIEKVHLDLLRRALVPAALGGDITAARLLVRIHTARALLLGLFAEQEVIFASDEGGNELDQLRARRRARREATS